MNMAVETGGFFVMKKMKQWFLDHKRAGILIIIAAAAVVLIIIGCAVSYNKNKSEEKAKEQTEEQQDSSKKAEKETSITYDTAGDYADTVSYDKGYIKVADVNLSNGTFKKLFITKGVGDGNASLTNMTVTEALSVNGGGNHSVTLTGGNYASVTVKKTNTHLIVGEGTVIGTLNITNTNYVEIYGSVNKLVVTQSSAQNADWSVGITVYEGASVGELDLQADIPVQETTGAISTVTVPEDNSITPNITEVPASNSQSSSSDDKGSSSQGTGSVDTPSVDVTTGAVEKGAAALQWQSMSIETNGYNVYGMKPGYTMPPSDVTAYCDQLTAQARDEASALYANQGTLTEANLDDIAQKYVSLGQAKYPDYSWSGGGSVLGATENSVPGYSCGYYSSKGSCFTATSSDYPGGFIELYVE